MENKVFGCFAGFLSDFYLPCSPPREGCAGSGHRLNSQMTSGGAAILPGKKLRQTEKTLETLGKQSKDTQAYLDALDQKIGYLRSQLKLTEQKVDTAENRITVLQKQQKKNRQDQAALQQQITDTKQQITVLDAQFQQNYQRYCQRLRAMYISGETNVLAFLLGSTDIGQLLTRYEMVARVASRTRRCSGPYRQRALGWNRPKRT